MLGAAILTASIADTRSMLTSLNLPKAIPVGNSDAGSYFNNKVLEAVDYGVICSPRITKKLVNTFLAAVQCSRMVCQLHH